MDEQIILEQQIASQMKFYHGNLEMKKENSFSDLLDTIIRSGSVDATVPSPWDMKYVDYSLLKKIGLEESKL